MGSKPVTRPLPQSTQSATAGLFVTFEGGEGSGKTTQIQRLAERLRDEGHRVTPTREPGGSPGADALRDILLSGAAEPLGNDMEAILFAAARIDHTDVVIRPALRRGEVVLCDRFLDSTRVYQGGASAGDPDFLTILEEATLDGLLPDLTLILDLPAEVGLRRAAARRGTDAADRFERQDVLIHEARRQAFLAIAKAEPGRCVTIDASADLDTVSAAIWAAVRERWTQRTPGPESANAVRR